VGDNHGQVRGNMSDRQIAEAEGSK